MVQVHALLDLEGDRIGCRQITFKNCVGGPPAQLNIPVSMHPPDIKPGQSIICFAHTIRVKRPNNCSAKQDGRAASRFCDRDKD
jgi:hypothetical protein